MVNCSPHRVVRLNPGSPGQGRPPLPGRAWACRERGRAPGVCVSVRGHLAHTLVWQLRWHQRLAAAGSLPQMSPWAAPLPGPLASAQPSPHAAHSESQGITGHAWPLALCLALRARTAQPLRPQLVPASTEGPAGIGRPPAHEGDGALPGRGGPRLRRRNGSFLEAKDTTTGMEGR